MPHPPPQPSTPRRLAHLAAVFVTLFLIVRTVALEPFGVPTGSMAPALIGNHREAPCPRCGYPVRVGEPGPDARPIRFDGCRCPNCDGLIDLSDAREVPGDRLLVDKTAYLHRPPRRWEVAVFRCPADLSKPYVKRVAGLPGERVSVRDGDLYADGVLQRKTLAQVRELLIPVFDQNYVPEPNGWAVRWLVEPVAGVPPVSQREKPVDDTILRGTALHLDGTANPVGLTYRHWNLDGGFEEAVGDALAYNGRPADRRDQFARSGPDPVHDFALSFDLEVLAGSGTFAVRLGDGKDTVRAEFPADAGGASLTRDAAPPLGSVGGFRPTRGVTHRVEFAFVDRRASLAVDGVEVVPALDLPEPGRRGPVSRPVQFGANGVSVVLRNVRLARDVRYQATGVAAGLGWQLAADECFMLGDNAGNSFDSRGWQIADRPAPGVPAADFLGKPFLIHQPMRLARVAAGGRERTFLAPDWGRLRWLR